MNFKIIFAFLFAFFTSLAIWMIIYYSFLGCAANEPIQLDALGRYPCGTVFFKDDHHSQGIGWAAQYDTVIVYGQKMMFKIMPKTDQVFGKYYEVNNE